MPRNMGAQDLDTRRHAHPTHGNHIPKDTKTHVPDHMDTHVSEVKTYD